MAPIPYKIAVPDEEIELLKVKLKSARFPDELEGAGHDVGAPLADVERLTKYWLEKFDWRKQEAKLNELPMFMTTVETVEFQEVDVHFVHQKSGVEGAIPLIFVHGWPGSFIEVVKMLPLLKQGGKDFPAFDVVAPSLPNFGFSPSIKKRGFGIRHYAEVCHKLMLQLGYSSYVTQGGDWGMFITRMMGRLYPDHVKASHTNFVLAVKMNFLWNPWRLLQIVVNGGLSAFEMAGYSRTMWYLDSGFGYFEIQSTRPQSLAYGLADSPVGLLGWLLEKLQDWTDDYPWTEDEILTWISIYWFSTAGPGASIRIYNEAANPINKAYKKDFNAWNWVPKIPLGLAYFPKDLVVPPLALGRTLGPVVHESTHKSGGHFAGWERPTELVEQLRKMFGLGGGAYGVVKGLSGYDGNRKDM